MADVARLANRKRSGRKTKIYRPSLSYTGCWTCRKRRVKCDERAICCTVCENAGLPCEGYGVELIWNAGDETDARRSRGRRRRIGLDEHTCNLMTEEEVSQALSRLEKTTSVSDSIIAGPFSIFNASENSAAGAPPANSGGEESPATIIEAESVSADSESIEEVQDAVPTVFSSESPEESAHVEYSYLPWVSETISDNPYISQSTAVGDQSNAMRVHSCSPFNIASSEFILAPTSFAFDSPPQVESQGNNEASRTADLQCSNLLIHSQLPRQIDGGTFPFTSRSSTNNLLIHHYAKHMVHLMQPIIHSSNPFEKIYLPLAMRGSCDMEHDGSPDSHSSPRVAVCHSLLSAAANNLQGLRAGESDLGAAAYYHRQKALVTLRNALASRSSAYKDLMTAILALVSVDILNGGTQDHWVHLDAAMQLQASRHFANVVSSETRQLNTICTMLHLFAQTALLGPEPKPWTGSCSETTGANLEILSPGIEYIYGISKTTANALLKIYKLSQCLAYHKEIGYPESLMQTCEDLGDELCSWSVATEEFAAIGRDQVSMLKVARAQAKAFHHAALIYYYRSIQQCSPEELHSEQQAVLAAMNEAEMLKKSASGDVAMPAPITWPAFIASCEAVGEERESWRQWWKQIQRYQMANYSKQQDIIIRLWQEMDLVGEVHDWREVLHTLGIRVLPV